MSKQVTPTELIIKKLDIAGQIVDRRAALTYNARTSPSVSEMMAWFEAAYEIIGRVVKESDFSDTPQEPEDPAYVPGSKQIMED